MSLKTVLGRDTNNLATRYFNWFQRLRVADGMILYSNAFLGNVNVRPHHQTLVRAPP